MKKLDMRFDEITFKNFIATKKEILDADGNVRTGCRILEKGEIYDIKWFSGRKDVFKDRSFLTDVKVVYTDLINKVVEREEDRLQIFDACATEAEGNGPAGTGSHVNIYLPPQRAERTAGTD